jgi:hypothetical protein
LVCFQLWKNRVVLIGFIKHSLVFSFRSSGETASADEICSPMKKNPIHSLYSCIQNRKKTSVGRTDIKNFGFFLLKQSVSKIKRKFGFSTEISCFKLEFRVNNLKKKPLKIVAIENLNGTWFEWHLEGNIFFRNQN